MRMASFVFLAVQLDSLARTLLFSMENVCTVSWLCSPTVVGLTLFLCSLNHVVVCRVSRPNDWHTLCVRHVRSPQHQYVPQTSQQDPTGTPERPHPRCEKVRYHMN